MADATASQPTGFARLSPWAILHFAAHTIMQLVSNAFALIPIAYGIYKAGSVAATLLGAAAAIVLVLLAAALRYAYFTYQIQHNSVQIRLGVLAKKQLNLQFHRIQNVNIEHPFYFRPLGLVTVKIDGAGSADEEIFLAALDLARAEEIREEIRRHHQRPLDVTNPGVESDADSEPDAEPDPAPLGQTAPEAALMLTRSLPDLVIHGLTNNRAWIILGGIGAAYGQASENINAFVVELGLDFSGIIANQSAIALALLAMSALMLAVVIMAALSVLGSIFSYYRFELYRSSDLFMVKRGLLTRHEINMKKSRIQAVSVRRDWLDMLLGRMNVVFEQITHSSAGQGNNRSSSKQILVPSVEPRHTEELTREALQASRLEAFDFTGISPRYFVKMAVITCWVYLLLAAAIAQAPGGFVISIGLAPLLVLHLFLLRMSWKRWGIAVNGGILAIRKGVLGVDHLLIPAFKIQDVGHTQTPLMKRHGLSTIGISVASRRIAVPFLPDETVRGVIDYCLFQTEHTDRSWM